MLIIVFWNEGRKVYKVTLHRLSEVSETVVGKQLVSNTVNVYAAMMRISAIGASSGDQLTVWEKEKKEAVCKECVVRVCVLS